MGLQRSSQAVVLCEAVRGGGGLWIVVSVSVCAAEIQGGFVSVGSVALHATEPPGGLQKLVPSCPVYRGTTEVPSSCGVFRGSYKLAIG